MKAGSWTVSSSLRLIREDIEVVSAHLQDAVVKAADIRWRPAEKRLVIALNRFDWEAAHGAIAGIPPPPRGAALRAGVGLQVPQLHAGRKGSGSEPARGLLRGDRSARRRGDADVLRRRRASARGRMPRGRTGRSRPRLGHRMLPGPSGRYRPGRRSRRSIQTGLTRLPARAIDR